MTAPIWKRDPRAREALIYLRSIGVTHEQVGAFEAERVAAEIRERAEDLVLNGDTVCPGCGCTVARDLSGCAGRAGCRPFAVAVMWRSALARENGGTT